MGALRPYILLAVAVAIGAALAPVVGWAIVAGLAFLALGFVVLFARSIRRRLTGAGRRWVSYMDREG